MTTKKRIEQLHERDLLDPIQALCRAHRALLSEVLEGCRLKHVVRARDACVLYLFSEGLSSTAVGELLNLDHTSALEARKRARVRAKKDA